MFFRSFVLGVFLSVLLAAPLYADDDTSAQSVEQPAQDPAAVVASPEQEPAVDTMAADPLQKGKTGIVAIDTLAVNEWDIPTKRNSLPLTMLFAVFPGGGQFYTEHYVRGGFITGIELLLLYEVTANKSYQNRRVLEQAEPFRDSVSYYTDKMIHEKNRDSLAFYHEKRVEFIGRVHEKSDKKMEQEDLRKAETAWMYGLYLYSFFDAFGIWYNNNYRSVELKSMKTALLWSIIPGFGQMYNREFGKQGLLYMAIIGSVTSIWTSQNMVEYYLGRKHIVELESTTSDEYERITERVTYYRKNRNQYIWALALIYLYSMGDAAVDALLSDFDNPMHLAVLPRLEGGIQALMSFDF